MQTLGIFRVGSKLSFAECEMRSSNQVKKSPGVQILLFDPLGRHAGSDNCFRTFCPFPLFKIVQKTKQFSSENSDRYWRDCGIVWPSGSLLTPVFSSPCPTVFRRFLFLFLPNAKFSLSQKEFAANGTFASLPII